MDIEARLLDLRNRSRKYVDSPQGDRMTETETRHLLINPLLVALGWDIDDLECVRQGWCGSKSSGEQKEADYALFLKGESKPCVIVEAKRFRANLAVAKTLTQTLMYAFLNGVEWCILTNGRQVVVYDAFSREPVPDRALFYMIDLSDIDTAQGTTAERATALLGMFSPEGLQSGYPAHFRQEHRIKSRLFYCLQDMIARADQSLVTLIRKRVNREYTLGQIAKCLTGLKLEGSAEGIPEAPPPKDKRRRPKPPKVKKGPRPGTQRAKRLEEWASLNTLVCPAGEDGFEEEFLGKNRWYAIRLRPKRIPFVKYIAIYRKKPVAAVTHYGEVESIKPWRNSGKYVVILKGAATEIPPVKIGKHLDQRSVAPQCPRFTTIEALLSARTLKDCWLK